MPKNSNIAKSVYVCVCVVRLMCVLGKQENEGELSFFYNNSLVVLKLELETQTKYWCARNFVKH